MSYVAEAIKYENETVIFEEQPFAGGLCHSFNIDGFVFDSAVHLSFTDNKEARDFFDLTSYCIHEPVSYNFYKDKWLKHPVVNNFYPLDVDEKVELIDSFVFRNQNMEIENYDNWLTASYGDRIAEKFHRVYTKKYWTVDASDLSTTWIGKRLNVPDLKKMLYGAMSDTTGNDYYAKEMRYPVSGNGYQSFIEPLIERCKIMYNKKAVRVDNKNKSVTFSDGSIVQYDRLISSIALPELISIMTEVPDSIRKASDKLKASKISLVSVGFNKPDIPKWIWLYVYDEDIMAARINSPSLKCSKNAPKGCSSLQFEIYHAPDAEINKDSIIQNVKESLKKMQICDSDDIKFMDYRLIPYGNVIFLKDMEKYREIVKEFVFSQGIELIGRFGEWEYYWSDQAYLSGKNKAMSKG